MIDQYPPHFGMSSYWRSAARLMGISECRVIDTIHYRRPLGTLGEEKAPDSTDCVAGPAG